MLFSTLVEDADDSGERHLVITWTGPENTHVQPGQQVPWTTKQEDDGNDGNDGNDSNDSIATTEFQLRVPLRPKGVAGLRAVPVDMHGATTPAYDMGDAAAAWFARRLGFEARLAYLGPRNSRPVLGSGAPGSDLAARRRLSPLAYHLRRWLVPAGLRGRPERISFCDIAQFLVVTAESNAEVTRRLREDVDGDPDVDPDASAAAAAGPGPEEGVEMDVTKFRPNIVLSGSPAAFDEDYWAELEFRSGSTSSSSSSSGVRMAVTLNCWRCQSIVVDYATGKPATGASGLAWKKLSRDRRVDKGWKYNPVFGRYGFCAAADAGREIRLGDEVRVTRRAEEVSVFGKLLLFFFFLSFFFCCPLFARSSLCDGVSVLCVYVCVSDQITKFLASQIGPCPKLR